MAEEKRIMTEALKEQMAEEMKKMQESLSQDMEAKMEAQRLEAEEKAREADEKVRAAQESVRRLSMTGISSVTQSVDDEGNSAEIACLDGISEIGDSASCVNPNLQATIAEQVKSLTNAEVERLVKEQTAKQIQEHLQKQEEVQEAVRALMEKNARLEKELKEKEKNRSEHEVSGLDLSPLNNSTPSRDHHGIPSPLALSEASPVSSTCAAQKQRTGERTKHSLLAKGDLSLDHLPQSGTKQGSGKVNYKEKRKSVAHEALSCFSEDRSDHDNHHSTPIGPAVDSSGKGKSVTAQRKWWAEQRGFLMEDLYTMGELGTNAGRSSAMKKSSRSSVVDRVPSPCKNDRRQSASPCKKDASAPAGRQLEGAFEEEAARQDKDGMRYRGKDESPDSQGIEWLGDEAPPTKMRVPQITSKSGGGYNWPGKDNK